MSFHVSTLMSTGHPNQIATKSGHALPAAPVIQSLVQLHLRLSEIYQVAIDAQVAARGVHTMLENPALGQIVVAWNPANSRVLGQLEIKMPFEVWFNARHWYLDNHVVAPDAPRGVGKALVDYICAEARNQKQRPLRMFVGHVNEQVKRYYERYGFTNTGHLYELDLDRTEPRESPTGATS